MQVSTKRLRRGGALVGIAGAGALVALGSAGAYVGGPGSGPIPHSNAPDLVSAAIVRTVNPSDALGPQARFCFDGPIATVVTGGYFIMDYDSHKFIQGTGTATPDPAQPTCVNITFPNGSDIELGTTGVVNTGGAKDVGGTGNPEESVPLGGSTLAATQTAGHTVAPDLVSATTDASNKQITYVFDENLKPVTTYVPGNFGFYIDTSNGAAPITATGGSIVQTTNKSVVVQFPVGVTNIPSAKQFFVKQDAVQDVTQEDNALNPVNTGSTIGSAGTQISGSPGLDSAVKNVDNQTVNLHFTQGVNFGSPAGVFEYREDAQDPPGGPASGILVANSLSTTNDSNNQTLVATFPADSQKDNASLVRVAVDPTAATARSGAFGVTYSSAALATGHFVPGYTDGPDLLSTTIDDATNRATFFYDEALIDTPVPAAGSFDLINPDGSVTFGQDGVVESADRKSVSVHFPSSVSATVGVGNFYNAVQDETQEKNESQKGSVAVGPVECQTGSCGTATPAPTGTAVPTATPNPTATATVTATPPTSKKSKLKSVKVKGGKVKGKVSASSPCKSGRTVKVKKGSKTLGSGKSKSSGSFSIKLKKHKKGHLKVTVSTRHVGSVTCKSTSKKISGKH